MGHLLPVGRQRAARGAPGAVRGPLPVAGGVRGALHPFGGCCCPGEPLPARLWAMLQPPVGAGGAGEAGCGGGVPAGGWESTRCKSVPRACKNSAVNRLHFSGSWWQMSEHPVFGRTSPGDTSRSRRSPRSIPRTKCSRCFPEPRFSPARGLAAQTGCLGEQEDGSFAKNTPGCIPAVPSSSALGKRSRLCRSSAASPAETGLNKAAEAAVGVFAMTAAPLRTHALRFLLRVALSGL